MLRKSEFWILTLLAALGFALAIANMILFGQNRQAQAEVNGRAQYVQQTVQLEQLYRELVKALADLSLRNNDSQLRELLTKQGITLTAPPQPQVPPVPAAEPKKGGK
jgi:uncharacterized membrane protein